MRKSKRAIKKLFRKYNEKRLSKSEKNLLNKPMDDWGHGVIFCYRKGDKCFVKSLIRPISSVPKDIQISLSDMPLQLPKQIIIEGNYGIPDYLLK